MGPRHSFWSVLGPAEAPSIGPGSRASRGGINPARSDVAENTAQAKVQELVLILGEANRVAGQINIGDCPPAIANIVKLSASTLSTSTNFYLSASAIIVNSS